MNRKILKITNATIICILLLVLPLALKAQRPNPKFRAVKRVVSLDKGSKVVRLNEVDGVGIAWILNGEFTTGEIEFDIKGSTCIRAVF